MEFYLYKITTKRSSVWGANKPKPVYYIAESKECARIWADTNLATGLCVSKIICLGRQIGAHIYVAL